MSPIISIIVPVYNAEKYLHCCIDSILEQSCADFELLLINDGSKDTSGKICDDYISKDSRVSVFHKENGGVSAARNYGLNNAKGKYICIIDADDWVDKDYLEQLLPENGEDMVVCSIMYEGKERRYVSISDNKRDRECIESSLHFMIEHMAICCPWCKIMRRDIIERNNIRFDENVSAGEDMLFVFDYFSTGLKSVRTISLPLYHYYVIDNDSLSHKIVEFSTIEYLLDCIKNRINNLKKVYNWKFEEGYKRLVWTQLNNYIAYVKNISLLSLRVRLIKKIIDNIHIQNLLYDSNFIIMRMHPNWIKTLFLKNALFLLKLYYLIR